MKKILTSTLLVLFSLLSTCKVFSQNDIEKINADILVASIDKYLNKVVEIEGMIVHVCGVDSLKMKLKTNNGAFIKIVNQDIKKAFPKSLYKKRIKVIGLATESRIEKTYIDSVEKNKLILCHIDKMPCKDSKWIENQRNTGKADSLSKQNAIKLRKDFNQSQKNYISVITIIAEKYEVIASPVN